MSYDLFFNKEKQHTADTIKRAVAACFGYLEAILRDYLDSPGSYHDEQAWIAIYDPIAETVRDCDRCLAEELLEADSQITLYVQTKRQGSYRCAQAKMYKKDTLVTQQQILATQQVTEFIKKILTTDETVNNWKPSDVHEIHVLRAAETRLFAIQLRKRIKNLPKECISALDRQCEFAEGTLAAMLHPTNPTRPTKKQIDKLARMLKMNPGDLWVDLLPFYMEQTGGFPAIVDRESVAPF